MKPIHPSQTSETIFHVLVKYLIGSKNVLNIRNKIIRLPQGHKSLMFYPQ